MTIGIWVGATEILTGKLNVGGAQISEVYAGATKVWPFIPVIPNGQALFTNGSGNSQQWLVPADVTEVHACCIGGGGNTNGTSGRNGGGGGALSWKNNIPVTPGQMVDVYIANSQQDSWFKSTGDCLAGGGAGRIGSSNRVGDGGGNGGNGGTGVNAGGYTYGGGAGGCGGYEGNGGAGGNGTNSANQNQGAAGAADSGAAGGGGGGFFIGFLTSVKGYKGGGCYPYGKGATGAASGADGKPGSGGVGIVGGGGMGGSDPVGNGSGGIVFIIWGEGRGFPLGAGDGLSS